MPCEVGSEGRDLWRLSETAFHELGPAASSALCGTVR